MTVLGSKEIRRLIKEEDLIINYVDLETQLQPNGFDLTVAEILTLEEQGTIDFDNSQRIIPKYKPLKLTQKLWNLKPGPYVIKFREIVNLPKGIMSDSIHRSSLMRCGAICLKPQIIKTCLKKECGAITAEGRWDAGYNGKGQTLLVVFNPYGLKILPGTRIVQMKFYTVEDVEEGYKGDYQHEQLNHKSTKGR